MNDQIQTGQTIILDGKVSLDDYKIYWRDILIEALPNLLIFWGIFAGGAFAIGIILRNSSAGVFFFFLSLLIAATPVLMTFFNYRSFLRASRRYVDSLPETDRHYNIIIRPDGKGIECMQGENFSFISWNSIRNVSEGKKYFSLLYQATPFLIMKDDFQNETDLRHFRGIIAEKLGAKAKLLR